jgi:hypothetical protein
LLSDITQDQRLDKAEFRIAMYFINSRLTQGRELPPTLPEALAASAKDEVITSPPVNLPKRNYDIKIDDDSNTPSPLGISPNLSLSSSNLPTLGSPDLPVPDNLSPNLSSGRLVSFLFAIALDIDGLPFNYGSRK